MNIKTPKFKVWKEGKKYIASGVGIGIVTEAKSLDELVKNVKEAVDLYFEETIELKKRSSRKISNNTSNLISYDITYA